MALGAHELLGRTLDSITDAMCAVPHEGDAARSLRSAGTYLYELQTKIDGIEAVISEGLRHGDTADEIGRRITRILGAPDGQKGSRR